MLGSKTTVQNHLLVTWHSHVLGTWSLAFSNRNFNRKAKWISPVHNFSISINRTIGTKGRKTNQTLVHYHPETPPITARSVSLTGRTKNFGRDIIRCTHCWICQLTTVTLEIWMLEILQKFMVQKIFELGTLRSIWYLGYIYLPMFLPRSRWIERICKIGGIGNIV